MSKFARLIGVGDEQVLLTTDYNDDRYELIIRTDVDGVIMQISAGFDELEDSVDAMNKYTIEQARKFRASMEKMMQD